MNALWLHGFHSGESFIMNFDHVIRVEHRETGGIKEGSVLTLSNGTHIRVKESLEVIYEMIKTGDQVEITNRVDIQDPPYGRPW